MLAPLVDVMIGNEEDFSAALGFDVEGVDEHLSALDPANFRRMIEEAVTAFPNFKVVATTLRHATHRVGQRLGRDLLGRTASSTSHRTANGSRSGTASAAATRSPPA